MENVIHIGDFNGECDSIRISDFKKNNALVTEEDVSLNSGIVG